MSGAVPANPPPVAPVAGAAAVNAPPAAAAPPQSTMGGIAPLPRLPRRVQFRDHPSFKLAYLPDDQILRPYLRIGSHVKVRFLCSAVGCIQLMPLVSISNRTKGHGRCRQCAARKAPLCQRKLIYPLPALAHDQFNIGRGKGLTADELIQSVEVVYGIRSDLYVAVCFWASLYAAIPPPKPLSKAEQAKAAAAEKAAEAEAAKRYNPLPIVETPPAKKPCVENLDALYGQLRSISESSSQK